MFRRLILALFILLLFALPAAAQEDDPASELQKELWCPICQGIRLDVCEQKVCEQMRDLIDDELAAGKSPEAVKAEFVDLYGPVVLGEPPREGFNLLAWIVPILLVVGGLIGAAILTRRWSSKSPAPVTAAATPASSDSPEPTKPSIDDDYLARVERDLAEQ